jgi:3-oxoacyl-[acyl-carrier protein] reductase
MNIIITGASRGIGFETALELSRDPQNTVVAIARNKQKLDELVSQGTLRHGHSNITAIAFDLNEKEFSESLLSAILKTCPTIDVIINNAGYLQSKPFSLLTNADWQSMFQVNVLGPVQLIRMLLPYMGKTQRAHIVNIGSIGGFQGSSKFSGLSAYSSSKAMLASLTECLAEEFKDENIYVNCLALGAVQTEMLSEAFPGYVAPLSAKQMATYIASFALSAQNYINGKIIPVSLSTP